MILYVMNDRKFEEVDISGDVGLRVRGETLEELFKHAGEGLYYLVVNTDFIESKQSITVEAKGESREGLLVAFLNELIYHFDAHGFIGREVAINAIDDHSVRATITGEEFSDRTHEWKLLLKAATYHNITVEEHNGAWSAFVMFDI